MMLFDSRRGRIGERATCQGIRRPYMASTVLTVHLRRHVHKRTQDEAEPAIPSRNIASREAR